MLSMFWTLGLMGRTRHGEPGTGDTAHSSPDACNKSRGAKVTQKRPDYFALTAMAAGLTLRPIRDPVPIPPTNARQTVVPAFAHETPIREDVSEFA